MAAEYTPYSTLKVLMGGGLPGWLSDPLEQQRVASYDLYEAIYWANPESFKLTQRGEDEAPIYIPAGRTIVETLHRYLANDISIIVDPTLGTSSEQQTAQIFFNALFKRERYYSKFNAAKRNGIIRGDWIFHIKGDPERPEGARISIETIHPGQLFPIRIPEDPSVVIGWHIVEIVKEGSKEFAQRTTYRKTTEIGGPSPITLEVGLFEVNAWGGPGQPEEEKLVRTVEPAITFPAPIDQLPIYHIRNFDNDDWLWGSSEMRGLERVLAAVNQSISDEELELVMNGLGVFATNASKPRDPDTQEELEWDLGPGRVVQVPGGRESFFNRVAGTTSVTPHQDHLKYLHEQINEAAGSPAIARGRVDVTTAESGVALMLQHGPLLARVSEKEQIVTDVLANFTYDLRRWVIAYEGGAFNFLENIAFTAIYGDKLPVNRKERFNEIMAMATAAPMPMIPMNVAWDMLREIGFELPENDLMLQAILEQRQAASTAEADAVASRIGGEMEDAETEETEEEVPDEQAGEEGAA